MRAGREAFDLDQSGQRRRCRANMDNPLCKGQKFTASTKPSLLASSHKDLMLEPSGA